jgi:hypothetical protein
MLMYALAFHPYAYAFYGRPLRMQGFAKIVSIFCTVIRSSFNFAVSCIFTDFSRLTMKIDHAPQFLLSNVHCDILTKYYLT